MTNAQKWLLAIPLLAIMIYYAIKSANEPTPTALSTGNPSANGLTLAENPSANPFRDLFSTLGISPASTPRSPAAAAAPSTAPKPTSRPQDSLRTIGGRVATVEKHPLSAIVGR